MKRFFRKLFFTAAGFGFMLLLLYIFRVSILRFIGNQLICEDKMEKVEALFVLSGDPWDRGNEAARLYKEGLAEKIICTGENVPRLFLIAGILYPESELTQMNIIAQGVPSKNVELLCKGTSTKEEADFILEYCLRHQIKKLAVVSTKFHTRRIQYTFRKQFKKAELQLIIHGAPSSEYDENYWWRNEEGLIFVNNEYIKIMYYRLLR
ncbi:MAG TPA: YdcF family protein [Chitinophagales bacterium]|nr:YdcF family protein [Chitinophagales bacterium]